MNSFRKNLIAETKRRIIGESIPRIKKCLNVLSEQEIWFKPNDHSNSVGNLVLHLCGNVTQWIGSGLGKMPDNRLRDLEFSEKGPMPSTKLIEALDRLIPLIENTLDNLTEEDFLQLHKVQVYQETGVNILVHVVEHFSYHTGQIAFFTKWRKNMDMNFYPEDLG
jgi:uncharacterized damage-inducible protein DinB